MSKLKNKNSDHKESSIQEDKNANINAIDVEVIPYDCTIDLKISGEFVARLSLFLTDFFPYKNKDHFNELVKCVKENTHQDDPYVYHFTTLIALQAHIEQEARLQNVTKTVKIDKITGKRLDNVNTKENQPSQQNQA